MKTILLTSVLTASSALSGEKPVELPVVTSTQSQMREIVSTEASLNDGGSQTLILLGSLLLGSALGFWADGEYRKRVPPEKRIGARVLRRLEESKKI